MTLNIEWEEYKILQDKIDSIGDFRFRVKGWTVTLIVGFILGGFATSLPSFAFLLGLLIVFGFHSLELHYVNLQRVYVSRISKLEHRLRKRPDPLENKPHFPVPGLFRIVTLNKKRPKSWFKKYIVLKAHNIYYLILYLIIVLSFIINLMSDSQSAHDVNNNIKSEELQYE
jgi:hypothetical protein